MKIPISETVKDYGGQDILLSDDPTTGPQYLTWKEVILRSLNSRRNDEPLLTAEDKNKIYQISKKLYESTTPNFTLSEVLFVLERIAIIESPMVMGQAQEFMSPSNESEPAAS